MESNDFVKWLMNEKNMSKRSAKDVLSRKKRVCLIIKADELDESSYETLCDSQDFVNCSMFIKSQLKRSLELYLEYKKENYEQQDR